MRSYAKAEAFCEQKTRHPLVKPGPIDARCAQKANWSDAAKLARLAEANAVAGGDGREGGARPRRESWLGAYRPPVAGLVLLAARDVAGFLRTPSDTNPCGNGFRALISHIL